MKILLKKYKIFLIAYLIFFVAVCIICVKRVNYSITTTGDITNVNSFISIENEYEETGSLNSIFVYSKDNATVFQHLVASLDNNASISKLNTNYSSFTDKEIYKMGVIQKNQSIEASIILAYTKAKEIDSSINVSYQYNGLIVYYYLKGYSQFQMGDIILKIGDVDISNETAFRESYKNMVLGTKVRVLRNSEIIDLTIDEYSTYNRVLVYDKYNIDYEATTPKIDVGKITSVGPSAGLLQTLSIYNKLVQQDVTKGKIICGTGTIDTSSNVGKIGGIEQKLIAAFKNKCQIFLCPEDNYEDAYKKYSSLRGNSRMKLYSIRTFEEALEVLNNA
ncbi:MAG: S16 family serine protease [Anaeroplasmataceae bacterium]